MEEDACGFRYPSVNVDICVDCHLCEKVCPMLADISEPVRPLKSLAAVNKNESVRLRSSSGGVFYSLAKNAIDAGGVVCGAVFDENYEVCHVVGSTMSDVENMMGSKYMQSRIEGAYIKVKDALSCGLKVLFVGTPCQVAGLNGFLRNKYYDNLLTVDLLCHGVPSPLVWRKYLNENFGAINGGLSVDFRNKTTGWMLYSLRISDGEHVMMEKHGESPFFKAFLAHLSLRLSCSACWFKKGRCKSDISLGDFWGVLTSHPEWNDDKGISVAVARTSKGVDALANCDDLSFKDVTDKEAFSRNEGDVEIIPTHPKRDRFFDLLSSGRSVASATKELAAPSLLNRVLRKVKRVLKPILPISVLSHTKLFFK